jgi:hypothetical protein
MRITGVRCRTCGAEVSHVVPDTKGADAFLVRHEDQLARDHEKTCPGPVLRFETGEAAK